MEVVTVRGGVKRARDSADARPTKVRRITPKAYYGRQPGEVKFFDTALSFSYDAVAEVPATGQLVLIPQGVTESTRVGRKCVIKSIHIRGVNYFNPGAGAVGTTTSYLYVMWDKQANGAAAAITDVFTSNVISTAMHNLANSQRFVVLKKIRMNYQCTAGVTTAYNPVAKSWELFKKCNIPLEFSSTAGAITELRSNNIFLMTGSDGNSDDTVACAATCRIRFSDGS